jgi:NAD(P)-dependent dehydrogenase (short-subunit alcohol dehydrogenase family)
MAQRAVIFGASGGIGAALTAALAADPRWAEIHAGARRPAPARGPVRPFTFDLDDDYSIATAMAAIGGPLDLVIIATGVLHDEAAGIRPERSLRAIDPAAMARVLAINTIGPALIARHALPLLVRDRRAVFAALSARVGSISDNRLGGWHSYRASKAALNMLIASFAVELARTHPLAVVAGLHPGTVDTALSAPFQRGLASGQLTEPDNAAGRLLEVIAGLTPADSGGCFAADGTRIPA